MLISSNSNFSIVNKIGFLIENGFKIAQFQILEVSNLLTNFVKIRIQFQNKIQSLLDNIWNDFFLSSSLGEQSRVAVEFDQVWLEILIKDDIAAQKLKETKFLVNLELSGLNWMTHNSLHLMIHLLNLIISSLKVFLEELFKLLISPQRLFFKFLIIRMLSLDTIVGDVDNFVKFFIIFALKAVVLQR